MSEMSESEFQVKYRKASDPMHKKVEEAIKAAEVKILRFSMGS